MVSILKGGPLQVLLAFGGDELGTTGACDFSGTMFLFAVRATQVDATIDVLLSKMVAVLAKLHWVLGWGVVDSDKSLGFQW